MGERSERCARAHRSAECLFVKGDTKEKARGRCRLLVQSKHGESSGGEIRRKESGGWWQQRTGWDCWTRRADGREACFCKAFLFFCDERRERNERRNLAVGGLCCSIASWRFSHWTSASGKKSQAIRGKLRLISCATSPWVVRGGRARGTYDATGERLLGRWTLAGAGDAPRGTLAAQEGIRRRSRSSPFWLVWS